MSHDYRRAIRLAALAAAGFALPAYAVEMAVPAGLEAGRGPVVAPAALAGAALSGPPAPFSAPALDPVGVLSAAPSALTAVPASALAADPRPEPPSADSNLRDLSHAIAGHNGPDGADKTAAAVARAYENSAGAGKADGIPLAWVDGMIAQSGSVDASTRRLQDIVQRLGFSKAALNRDVLQAHNDKYTVEIPMGDITDQKQSGRCWFFAGLNMIRSTLLADKKVTKDFEFSENYLQFFNMLEKSNRHLEEASRQVYQRSSHRRADIVPKIVDGGWYEGFAFLVSKYGLAPKSVMGETISSEATAVMRSELDDSLAATTSEMLANAKRYKAGREPNRAQEIQRRAMSRVWKILATHLGVPPARFDYRDAGKTEPVGRLQVTPVRVKTYTPREFARDFVKFDPRDYVVIGNFPDKKENAVYGEKDSAIGKSAPGEPDADIRFLNVSSDRLEKLAADAIKAGQPVWFAADVNNSSDKETGIMHPRLYDRASIYQFAPDEAAPALTRKQAAYFGRIKATHGMVLAGFDQPDPLKPIVKFKVENSWGEKAGTKGVFHLYREWFHQYVFEIVVPKRFLSDEETRLWRGSARKLPKGWGKT